MQWKVKTPRGPTLEMLPPGTSEGAETNPECYRVAMNVGRRSRRLMYATAIMKPEMLQAGAPFCLKKWGLDVSFTKKMV